MPNVDAHAPGSFCWFELGTTDQNAAKQFYGSLFGWSSQDFPMGPSGTYTMFQMGGRDVGAVYTLNPQQQAMNIPPNWMPYLSVTSADDTAKHAGELGGQVFMPPFDVMSHGRMTALADPTGAYFSIWQPKEHFGVGVTGIDGTVCWADLSTPDTAKAKDFYSALFGWKIESSPNDPTGYEHIQNGEEYIGGIPPAQHRAPGTPAHWMLYFATSDCAATAKKAQSLGAGVLMEPSQIEKVGTIAILKDPQGAVFALFQPPAQRV